MGIVSKDSVNPCDRINIGFIGVGYRAEFALNRFRYIKGARIAAICDSDKAKRDDVASFLKTSGVNNVAVYASDAELLNDDTIDLVYISTPWASHAAIAVEAMKQGKHVALEVPAAMTIDECWALVHTAEATQKTCSILENCCYDEFTLAMQNMIDDGLLGDIYHCEGAYIHRLCERMIGNNPNYKEAWMPQAYMQMNGNIYPTHGFGPLAMALGLNRGDRAVSINSISTKPRVYNAYVKETYGEDVPFTLGDVSSSLITTESGKTVELQFDIATPRPYSRKQLVSGTKGMYHKYPTEEIALMPDYHQYLSVSQKEELLARYRHPIIEHASQLFKNIDNEKVQLKGVMDFAMDLRLVQCLQAGVTPDLDVYDAAMWSSLVELSATSAGMNGAPVAIPDFTCGRWKEKREAFASIK